MALLNRYYCRESKMAFVRTGLEGSTGTITLDNARKKNALGSEMIAEAIAAFEFFESRGARAVVLRAQKGAVVFSAGHDVSELPSRGRDPLAYNDPLEMLVRAIRHFSMPVICLVEGTVWGGACEVCLACDVIVCEQQATFALTPAKLGVPYNITGLLNVRNALGTRFVREMLFTAQPLSSARLYELGIINHLCSGDEIEACAYEIASQICNNSPLSIRAMKEQLRILDNASPLNPETFERLQGLRRSVYDSKDYEEGIRAFHEKRAPVFTGE